MVIQGLIAQGWECFEMRNFGFLESEVLGAEERAGADREEEGIGSDKTFVSL